MGDRAKSDTELLRAYVDRQDMSAFEELYRRYDGFVYSVCYRYLRSRHDAEDATLACFIVLQRKAATIADGNKLMAWLHTCAAKTAWNAAVARRRRHAREQEAYDMELIEKDGKEMNWESVFPVIEMEMARLPAEQSEVLVLHFYKKMSRLEIAETLGCPEGTIAARIARGLARLRNRLVKKGVALTEDSIATGMTGAALIIPAPAGLYPRFVELLNGNVFGSSAHELANATIREMVMTKIKTAAALAAGLVVVGGMAVMLSQVPGGGNKPPMNTGATDSPSSGSSAPVALLNPVAGVQDREEVFEFTEKPRVTKSGEKYIVTFASRAKCDATVCVVDKQGKVIRHLASGVLGANAPWPLQQNTLSQKLEWDGKDDTGQPASAECKIKVALGLRATLGKAFGDDYKFAGTIGLTTDKAGNLYVMENAKLRRYTRDGKYAQTLVPPRGGVTPETFGGCPWVETVWGEQVLMAGAVNRPFLNFSGNSPFGTPVVGADGRIAVIWNPKTTMAGRVTRLHLIGPDGSLPGTASMTLGTAQLSGPYMSGGAREKLNGGINHMAVSPDGEWLYVSGVGDAVLRYRWKDLKGPAMPLQVFKGSIDKSGEDNESFNLVSGVACDRENNVYISDNGNNRIQVYKQDGVYLRTIAIESPHRIAVHPRTGDIYVTCWRSGDFPGGKTVPSKTTLVRVDKDGKVCASKPIDAAWHHWHYALEAMALDSAADPPAIWLADRKGVFKVIEKASSFEEVLRLGSNSEPGIYAGIPTAGTGENIALRVVADPCRDDVYLGSGSTFQDRPWVRIDGRTGKIDQAFKDMKACELAIGPDGLIYARVGPYGRFIVRYTRDGVPVPFKKGVKISGISGLGAVAGGEYTAIFTGVRGWSNIWQSGLHVSPNGDIVVQVHELSNEFVGALYPSGARSVPVKNLDMQQFCKTGTGGGGGPGGSANEAFAKRRITSLVEVWHNDGNEKCISAFEAPYASSGVAMDSAGSIYMVSNFIKDGQKNFESMKPGQTRIINPAENLWLGSLVKFGSKGGKWPIGYCFQNKEEEPGLSGLSVVVPKAGSVGGGGVSGVAWIRHDASEAFPGGCGCGHSRFSLDRFGRSWLPANHIHSVLVYDSNGNKVLRVGRYGNVDSRGKGSLVPDPDIGLCAVTAVSASDDALYAVDVGNTRTVRIVLSYQAEETVALQ